MIVEPSRAEHLEWCKQRALAYLEHGEFFSIADAGASLISDLGKHPETSNHPARRRCFSLLASGADAEQMRAFIRSLE